MIDEDTGEEPTCPYCGSAEDCPHLLAVLDKNFPECRGGYCYERMEQFSSRIEAAFFKRLGEHTRRPPRAWNDPLTQELWEQVAQEQRFESADDIALDDYVFIRLIVDVLADAGGDWYGGSLVDDGGPGMCSSTELFYAEDPKAVFEKAVEELDRRLSDVAGVRHRLR